MQNAHERIVKEVSSWEGVTTAPHRFGGTEFRLGRRQIGHIHRDYFADIAFPMTVRNQLIAEGRAEPHHIIPGSGWVTFRFEKEEDIEKAIELFKMSYESALEKYRGEISPV